MKTAESYLKTIEKLRKEHTFNDQNGKWEKNDTVRRKIITAWEGYHVAISKQLDRLGCATGNEHCDYSVTHRINSMAGARDYFHREMEKARKTMPDANTRE